jgi:hypothetical protein
MGRAMPLFDFYIMADWSGGARRRGGRSDTIWIWSAGVCQYAQPPRSVGGVPVSGRLRLGNAGSAYLRRVEHRAASTAKLEHRHSRQGLGHSRARL